MYRQPFSLANDVSSFQYSSPVVSYSNQGLLSQIVGKLASQPQAKAVAAAPAPVAYQQKVAYAPQPAQIAYAQAPQKVLAAAPQQYYQQEAQQYVAAPQAQTYQAAQTYTAQTAPQSIYAQAPQYYVPQQGKQATPGVAYAQWWGFSHFCTYLVDRLLLTVSYLIKDFFNFFVLFLFGAADGVKVEDRECISRKESD